MVQIMKKKNTLFNLGAIYIFRWTMQLIKLIKAVFSSVGCKRKKILRFESSQFEALNEVYL